MSQSSPASGTPTQQIGGAPSQPVFNSSPADASRGMLLFVLVVVTLYFGREVLVPITLAFLLAFLLAPLVTVLRKIHLGRIPSVLLAVVLALVVLMAIGGIIGSQIADLTADLPKYAGQIETKVKGVEASTIGQLTHLIDRVGTNHGGPAAQGQNQGQARGPHGQTAQSQAPKGTAAQHQTGASPPAAPTQNATPASGNAAASATAPNATAQATPAPPAAAGPAMTPYELIMKYLAPILSPFATLGIVIVVTVFTLLQREDLRDRMIRLIGSDDIHRTTLAMDDAGRRLSRYFLTQLAVNTFFGLVIGVGLFFLGVPKPVLWGLLSALLRFVPYVGSLISALLPVALAAAVEPGWSMALWTAGFFIVAEGVTGQAVEPLLYGHSTGLSPFSVVVAAIFWSWVWGPIGLILSTPLTLCLVVMGRHVKRLEFLDVMLGDQPALTPVESFYQRILADDPDEALDQAEGYLKQETLHNYYDKVVLKAMQMAAFDAERGVLLPQQLNAVVKTIQVLVGSLEEHGDDPTPPPPPTPADEDVLDSETPAPAPAPAPPSPEPTIPTGWSTGPAILCIAGRGALDEPATAMLTQLLARQQFGSRAVSHAEVTRDAIAGLDVSGAKAACVAYLDVSASKAQLRYLIRRLRQKLPRGTPIIVGLWPVEDAALHDQATRAMIGADHYVSSFEDVLTTCATLAQNEPAPEVAADAAE